MPRLSEAAPTLSDAAKIGWKDDEQRETELLLQQVYTNDFSSDSGELTEEDAGANVEVSGGVLKIKGSTGWNINGVYLTTLKPYSTPGRFKIQLTPKTSANHIMIGFANAAALAYNDVAFRFYAQSVLLALQGTSGPQITLTTLQDGTLYTFEFEWDADKTQRGYITGGVWTPRTRLFDVICGRAGANVGFQINCYVAFATQWEFDNFEILAGYDTGGEFASFVHDAGAGQVFSGFDLSNFAMPGTVASTNLKFRYSYDDGTPSMSGWLTLAQLQAEGAQAGNKRYIRIDVQSNSDGDTQVNGAEPNADDAVAGIFAQPSAAIILTGNTVNDVAGAFDESARNTDPGIANVTLDVTYKIQNVDYTGTVASNLPSTPDIAVAWLTATSVRVTFSNSDAGTTNEVRYALKSDGGDTWIDGGSRTGDGTVDVTGLTAGGIYYVIGFSNTGGSYSEPSEVVEITLVAAASATPTLEVSQKMPLKSRKVLKESRDATITQSIYNIGVGGTLAKANLEPGDALPDDANSEILESSLSKAPGTGEELATVIARDMRVWS